MEIDTSTQYFIGILLPAACVVIFAFLYYKKVGNDTSIQKNGNKGNQQQKELTRFEAVNELVNVQQHGGPRQYSTVTPGGGKLPKGHQNNRGVNKQQRHEKGNTTAMHSHSWLITSLKGHTNEIRDIDFSNNGKYLASCAEDGQLIGTSQNATNRHCNSNTSNYHNSNNPSDLIGSDDINSKSGNEDVSSSPHLISYVKSNRNVSKSCRNQQQRKNQHPPSTSSSAANSTASIIATGDGDNHEYQHHYSASNIDNNVTMYIDDESKENKHPLVSRSSVGGRITTGATKYTALEMKNHKETSGGGNTAIISPTKKNSKHSSKQHHLKSSGNTTSSGGNLSKHPATSSTPSVPINSTIRKEYLYINSRPLSPPLLTENAVLNLDESKLRHFLRCYVIPPCHLEIYGYPVESPRYKGCVEIYKYTLKSFHVNRSYTDRSYAENSVEQFAPQVESYAPPPSPSSDRESKQASHAKSNGLTEKDANHLSGDSGQGSESSSPPSTDSGQGSESSSPPSVDSDVSDANEDDTLTPDKINEINDTASPDCNPYVFFNPGLTYNLVNANNNKKNSFEKTCCRCKAKFHVTNKGQYLTKDECFYHWGKSIQVYDNTYGMYNQFSCCNAISSSKGCTKHPLHVWSGVSFGHNGPYTDFVSTEKRKSKSSLINRYINKKRINRNGRKVKNGLLMGNDIDDEDSCDDSDILSSTSTSSSSSLSSSPSVSSSLEDEYKNKTTNNYNRKERSLKAFAVDCEMCFTGYGLEVAKVTVIGLDGELAYETFVRPKGEIVDYNTRFSGITEEDLSPKSSNVKTLETVQKDLLKLFSADTILIGHALENDLRVLKIVHKNVIDTSITFPHHNGFPYRRALKTLTKCFLNRDIQTCESGHNSLEDSRACLDLILWKVRKDFCSEFEQKECTNECN